MKIEVISDSQIKFILNQSDLTERNIKLTELSYGSEKIQELFHEMLEEATAQYGVDFSNRPLMIEAIPVSLNSIMIIVTKVTESSDLMSKLESYASPLADFIKSRLQNIGSKPNFDSFEDLLDMHLEQPGHEEIKKETSIDHIAYTFGSLDVLTRASLLVDNLFLGESQLYKKDGLYYLLLDVKDYVAKDQLRISFVLGEFGNRISASYLTKYMLEEHGEVILANNAIKKLTMF